MKKRATLAGIFIAGELLLCGPCAFGQVPIWKSDTTLQAQLATPMLLGSYQLQLPRSYILVVSTSAKPSDDRFWIFCQTELRQGQPTISENTQAILLVRETKPPAKLAGGFLLPTLSQFLTKITAQFQSASGNWKQSPSEQGLVNGRVFVRTYFTCEDLVFGAKRNAHGFIYVVQDGRNFIELMGREDEPYQKTRFPLMEASILTFTRRKPRLLRSNNALHQTPPPPLLLR